jgi:CrcB protein
MPRAPLVRPRLLGAVVAGGMLGVALRALLTTGSGPDAIAAATLAINVGGSFGLGVVVGLLGARRPALRAFFGTGVFGGFTTYSAFAVQAVEVTASAPLLAAGLAVVSVALGIVAAAAGLALGRDIARRRGSSDDPSEAE